MQSTRQLWWGKGRLSQPTVRTHQATRFTAPKCLLRWNHFGKYQLWQSCPLQITCGQCFEIFGNVVDEKPNGNILLAPLYLWHYHFGSMILFLWSEWTTTLQSNLKLWYNSFHQESCSLSFLLLYGIYAFIF